MTMDLIPSPELEVAKIKVMSGIHNGVVQSLQPGVYSIGASQVSDLVLADPGLELEHIRVAVEPHAVSVVAVNGPATADGKLITPGNFLKCSYPVEITLGETQLHFSRTKAVDDQTESKANAFLKSPRGVIVAGSVVAVLIVLAFGSLSTPTVPRPDRAPRTKNLTQSQQDTATDQKMAVLARENSKKAAAAFIVYLAATKLSLIKVEAGAREVIASGFIDPSNLNAWRTAQIWFDEHFGRETILVADVSLATPKVNASPIQVQAVWAGATPYIMDGNGDKYFVGWMLKDGWIVEKIEKDKVTLRRDEEVITLKL